VGVFLARRSVQHLLFISKNFYCSFWKNTTTHQIFIKMSSDTSPIYTILWKIPEKGIISAGQLALIGSTFEELV
jgi:hypothetical protein